MDIIKLFICIGAVGISLIIHEVSHAYSAYLLGDSTGKDEGRITLNPFAHVDLFMTIIVPVMTLVVSNGTMAFGGAKPVRINPLNFRNPSKGMMITAAAGPFSNILLAVAGFGLLYLLHVVSPDIVQAKSYNAYFFAFFILINVFLAAFNLIPVPPMDGSRILRYFAPEGGKRFLDSIEPFGLIIIASLLGLRFFDAILAPCFKLFTYAFLQSFGDSFTVDLFRNIGILS